MQNKKYGVSVRPVNNLSVVGGNGQRFSSVPTSWAYYQSKEYAKETDPKRIKANWPLTWAIYNDILNSDDMNIINAKVLYYYVDGIRDGELFKNVFCTELTGGKIAVVHGNFANPVLDFVIDSDVTTDEFVEKVGEFAKYVKAGNTRALPIIRRICGSQGFNYYDRNDFTYDGWKRAKGTGKNGSGVQEGNRSRKDKIKQNLSTVNSAGEQLSEGQQEYFKDSKVRDADGNLLKLFHGTTKGGFTVFDSSKSDDKTTLFFSDSSNVSSSYGLSINAFRRLNITNDQYAGDKKAKRFTDANEAADFLRSVGMDVETYSESSYPRAKASSS